MPKRNHIKVDATADNTLRGIGKLGYTESGKLHSTIKKITATFEDKPEKSNKNKEVFRCPGCNGKFTSNNGKLKNHKPVKSYSYVDVDVDGYCTQKPHWLAPAKIESVIKTTTINDLDLFVGDTILFQPYPYYRFFDVEDNKIIEAQIMKIFLMTNGRVYLRISGYKKDFPINLFEGNKNFLKA